MFKNRKPVVAIDGTACSGKGTLAKMIAKHFSFDHLDSGILYRIFAFEMLEQKVSVQKLKSVKVNFEVIFDKKKLTSMNLRSEKISKISSEIAKEEYVRKQLISIQRKFADNPPCGIGSVIDGRDITSVIIPNAEIKFYIDADVKIRAQRRLEQLKLNQRSYQTVLEELIKRDSDDMERKLSPLKRTKESFYIETTNLNERESFKIALDFIKNNSDII